MNKKRKTFVRKQVKPVAKKPQVKVKKVIPPPQIAPPLATVEDKLNTAKDTTPIQATVTQPIATPSASEPAQPATPVSAQPPTATSFDEKLYNQIKDLGVIDQKKLDDSFAQSKQLQTPLSEMLFNRDLIDDVSLGKIIGDMLSVPFVNLSEVLIPQDLTYLIPEEYARRNKVIAFALTDTEVKIAMVNPMDADVLKQFIAQKAGRKASVFLVTQRDFEKSLKMYKQNLQESYDDMLKAEVNTLGKEGVATEAPIERIVAILVEYAYDNGASDIHIEPEKEKSVVRFRVDGVLQEVLSFSTAIHTQIVSRIKYLAKLRTDEHLSAQDGKIQTKIENEELDIRVSIVPIVHGEKCVLRLLSARYRQFGLSDLGMNEVDLKKVTDASNKPFGMILSTGPTGSGKTTTMYAILKILNTKERNIATIEDPVEYEIEGLNQIQVNAKTNLTFAEGLRSILRQDPNIIYVGEIRDNETADIAVNSAMTGHLVLSTLHTNDAATALPRLLDMSIEPFLVASTINSIIGQRLVRKICDKCKVSQTIPMSDLEKHFDPKMIAKYFSTGKEALVYMGKGCPVCKGTGYMGRIGIYEILVLSEKIQDLVVAKADSKKIMEQAVLDGMTTMTEDGLSKVQQSITTIDEVLRATRE